MLLLFIINIVALYNQRYCSLSSIPEWHNE